MPSYHDEQEGWSSEGASDYLDDDHFDDHFDDSESASDKVHRVVRSTRYHRKFVSALLLAVLLVAIAFHQGKAQPYAAKVMDNVHELTAYIRSPAGVTLMWTLAALIAIDLAVDISFGAWSKQRRW